MTDDPGCALDMCVGVVADEGFFQPSLRSATGNNLKLGTLWQLVTIAIHKCFSLACFCCILSFRNQTKEPNLH
jgi:hypothetical protein